MTGPIAAAAWPGEIKHRLTPRPDEQVRLCWAVLAVLLAGQIWIMATRSINWDEFFFYSQIETFRRGEYLAALQTLHVRLLLWVTKVPGTAVDRILVGRMAMFAAELVSIAAIIGIATRLGDRLSGLACALAYASAGFVMQHGFSFRTDPLASGLLMASLWILACAPMRWKWLALFAVLAGAAPMITIKAVLYFPAFLGLGWLRWQDLRASGRSFWPLAFAALGALAIFGLIYLVHQALLAPGQGLPSAGSGSDPAATSRSGQIIGEAASRMFDLGGFRYGGYLVAFVLIAVPFVGLIAISAALLVAVPTPPHRKVALAGLLATGLAFIYYRNALPYFFPFILAPVAAGCAAGARWLLDRYSVHAFVVAVLATGAFVVATEGESRLDAQRQLQHGMHAISPRPAAYFDFPAMFGEYPKANGFLTIWGVERYLEGEPIYGEVLRRQTVPLLVTNDPAFNPSISDAMVGGPNAWTFLDQDRRVLQDTYIPYWGRYGSQERKLVPGPHVRR